MGKTNVYASRNVKAVRLGVPTGSGGAYTEIGMYGFLTNIDEAESSELGHVNGRTGAGGYIDKLVIGANSPQPARYTKKVATHSVTSYCGHDKVSQAVGRGWKKAKGVEYRLARSSVRSKVVYLTIRGIKYAWRQRTEQFNKLKNYSANLGIAEADSSMTDLVYGPSFPIPPKVGIIVPGEGGQDNLSTFCDPRKVDNLPEGWSLIDPGNYA